VSSKDLRTAQRDALSALQQMRTASAVGAALQQIAQAGMVRPDGTGANENVVREVGEQYLVFTLDNRDLAIRAEQVQGVERLADVTVVPNVISWVKGVMRKKRDKIKEEKENERRKKSD